AGIGTSAAIEFRRTCRAGPARADLVRGRRRDAAGKRTVRHMVTHSAKLAPAEVGVATESDFLRRCSAFHLMAQRAWGRRFLGRGVDRWRASATEASGVSDYTRGDDFRYVDWNRCARHDELVSKQF